MDKIELRVQETYTVTLKGLGASGYRWSAIVRDPNIVRVERAKAVRRAGENLPGSSMDEQFILTAVASGETIANFVQARSFEPAKPPHATYDVIVCVAPN